MEQMNRSTRTAVIVWYVLVVLIPLAGLTGLVLSLVPYPGLKTFFDRLAKDGNFERLTPQLYQTYQLPLLIVSGLVLLLFLLTVWKARKSQLMVISCVQFFQSMLTRLFQDVPRFLSGIVREPPSGWEMAILLVIVVFGFIARLVFIQRGIEYDEAYTYIEFARHSFGQVISDYHLPNNHVFHTLLVHLSTRVFGGTLWAVRIPAFTAGVLILPAVYLLGRKLYRPWAGLTAAGLLAAAPVMIFYSVNARGYTLITLFTLLLFILADIVRKEKNLAAWSLMILITGLGFYTIPVMLYPFGCVFTWLLLAGLSKEIDDRYGGWKGWLRYLIGYGFSSALLSIFFYVPIFRIRGFLTVFNNDPIVRSRSLDKFFSSLPLGYEHIQADWLSNRLPVWLISVLLAGIVLSFILHSRIGRSRVNILLAALLFLIPVLLIQRPILLPRVWVFILPLMVLASLSGWMALLDWLPWIRSRRNLPQNAAAAVILAIALWGGGQFLGPIWQVPGNVYFDTTDNAALVTQYIKETLSDGDVVVVTPLYDARFWFYFDYYKIPNRHIRDVKRQHFTRVLVIASNASPLSVEEIVDHYGPDLVFLQMETVQETYRSGNFIVYQISPHQDLVDQTYGLAPALK